MASLAWTNFGTYGLPQLHDALASTPQLVHSHNGFSIVTARGLAEGVELA
jgi:hypothetical protein